LLSGHSECLLRGSAETGGAYIALRRPVADGDSITFGFIQPLLQNGDNRGRGQSENQRSVFVRYS